MSEERMPNALGKFDRAAADALDTGKTGEAIALIRVVVDEARRARDRESVLAMALRDAKTALERCGDPEFSAARVMVQEYARIHAQAAGVALSGGAVEDPRDASLQKCATVLDRCLVEWCDGCGRKRDVPGPCPHCSADGRHVATTADAPDRLCALLADLRAGVEPKP